MKLMCDAKVLKGAITRARLSIDSRAVGALQCLRLDADGSTLTVTGWNMDRSTAVSFECNVVDNGSVLIHARTLADAVKGAKGPLEIVADGERVSVGGFTLRAHNPITDWPAMPTESPKGSFELDLADVALVIGAASTDMARPLLTMISVDADAIACTDSYRLYAVTERNGGGEALLPAKWLAQFLKVKGLTTLAIETTENYASTSVQNGATTELHTVYTGQGTYPNWRQLIPASWPFTATFDHDAMIDALKAASAIVKDNTTSVRLSRGEGGVKVKVVSHDLGDFERVVPGSWPDEIDVAAFNPYYWTELLEGTGATELHLTDASRPCGVTTERGVRLLMPVRVQ